jgi:hypothetical protein
MSLFHQHSWQEKERFYAKPVTDFTAKLGVTTILYICTVCNEIKTMRILGASNVS